MGHKFDGSCEGQQTFKYLPKCKWHTGKFVTDITEKNCKKKKVKQKLSTLIKNIEKDQQKTMCKSL